MENAYRVIMKLTINSVGQNDFGAYKCVSKNSLGDTDGTIKLYRKYSFQLSKNKLDFFKKINLEKSIFFKKIVF